MLSSENPFEHLVPKEDENENPFEHLVPKKKESLREKMEKLEGGPSIAERIPGAALTFLGDIAKMGGKAFTTTLNEGAPAAEQIYNDPLRVLQNLGVGGAGLARNIVNIPYEAPRYLEHLNLMQPQTSSMFQKMIGKVMPYNEVPDVKGDVRELFGMGPQQKGDIIFQGLVENAPFIPPVFKAARGATRATVAGGKRALGYIPGKIDAEEIARGLGYERELSQIKNALPEAERNVLEKGKIESQAAAERAASEKALEEEKYAAATSTQVKSSTPSAIQLDINQANERLTDINRKLEESRALQAELKRPEEYKPTETAHAEKYEAAKQRTAQAEESISKAEQLHEEAKRNAERSEEALGTHLEKEATHDVQLMAPLDKFVTDIEKASSKNFNEFHKELEETKFQIPPEKMAELEKINTEPMKNNKYYKAVMAKAPKVTDTNAATYFAKWRSFRDAFYDLRKDSGAHGIDAAERLKMKDAVAALKPARKIITDTLETGIGPEMGARLEKLNEHHREVVVPLRGNKLIKAIRNPQGKELPANIAASLRLPRKGNILIKDFIKKNPELIKNVVGQRYAASAKSIHKPNQIMQEFINAHPETKAMIEQRNQSFKAVKETKKNIEEAKKLHKRETKKLPEEKAQYEAKESEISGLTKENQKKIKEYEEQNSKLDSEIKKYEEQIKTEKSDNKARESALKQLKEKSDKKNVSLQEHMKAKKEYDEAKKRLSDSQKKVSAIEKKLDASKKKLAYNKGAINRMISVGKKIYKHGRKLF